MIQEESEEEEQEEDENEDEDDSRLLPAELLAQAAAEDAKQPKRSHLTAADFERMEAEEEEAEKKAKKRRIQANERRVGEYTVKVLNNRPRPAPTDTKILNFRDRLMHRKTIPRKDAMLSASKKNKRIGQAAYQFHRK